MPNGLLTEALFSLSGRELRDFGFFLESPYFNRSKHTTALFQHLLVCRRQDKSCTSEAAFAALWPKDRFNAARLRAAASDLYALLERFLYCEKVLAEEKNVQLDLAEIFRNRGLEKNAASALRKTRERQSAQTFRDAAFLYDQMRIEWELFRRHSEGVRTEALNIQAMADAMDVAFVAQRLRQMCLAASHLSVFSTDYRPGLSAAILDYVEAENLAEIPAVGLYYYCYRFMTDNSDEASFDRFNILLSMHADRFPVDELRNFFLLAINYGIKHINSGKKGRIELTFNLYKEALARELLFENERLSRFAYNNIVAVGIRTGEAAWTENFIHTYKDRLERKYREVTFSLNLARLAYFKKDYPRALMCLQKADYKDLINNFIAKTLQLKIYCELGESDLLEAHLNSMQNYVRRKANIAYHRENYRLLIHFTRRLIAHNPFDAAERAALRASIAAEERLVEKDWFLERLG